MNTKLDFSFDKPVDGEELLGGTGEVARALWLTKRVCNEDVYFMQDGTLSHLLFKEVLSCFVAGHYFATIILGFSLIERTVAGRLSFIGDKKSCMAKSKTLLQNAFDRGWLEKDEYELLGELRQLRNPIAHFRDYLSKDRPESKAAMNACTTEQVLEADAKKILDATIHLLKKTAI